MTAFQDALYISSALIMLVLVPWGIIGYPAIALRFMGDFGPATLLAEQGFHMIAFVTMALILLVLLIGAWIDR